MAAPAIPEEVARFILLAVPSVPYLEAILLLCETSEAVESPLLARRLYLSESAASKLLEELHGNGVLELVNAEPPAYRYCPQNAELRQMIDRLAEYHAKNLVGVTNLIHSKVSKKAQQIADALIWRKDA